MKYIVSLALASVLFSSAPAMATDHHKSLQFCNEQQSISLSNSVVRGDRDIYHINGQKGAYLSIKISSLEDNACLQVSPMVNSVPIPYSIEEKPEGFSWTCELPVSGAYNIRVSGSMGNCTYKMEISVIE